MLGVLLPSAAALSLACPPDGKVDTSVSSADTAQFYGCVAYDCRCTCTIGVLSTPLLLSDVCVPVSAASREDHCRDSVCPMLETAINFARGNAGQSCDATCEFDEARAPHPSATCGTCESVRFVGEWDESESDFLSGDNLEEATWSFSSDVCGSGGSGPSDEICREGMPTTMECEPSDAAQGGADTGAAEGSAATNDARPQPILLGSPFIGPGQGRSEMCVAGGGEFLLVPARSLDRNGDGKRLVVSRPVQVSGTGRFTADSRVTRLWSQSSGSADILALRSRQPARVGWEDSVLDPGRVTIPVATLPTLLAEGAVGGTTQFLSSFEEDVHATDWWLGVGGWDWRPSTTGHFRAPSTGGGGPLRTAGRMIDMEWACPEPDSLGSPASQRPHFQLAPGSADVDGLSEALAPGEVYEFSLDDVGCPADWPQRFTLRLGMDIKDRPALSLALYGNPSARKTVALHGGDGLGYSFTYAASGLVLAGRVLGADAAVAAVQLDEVSYAGVPMCAPGVYVIKRVQLPSR